MSIDATKIANRACQRVGAARIAAGSLFTEDSNSANEIAACYDILRRAELRRNFWRFSIRRAPLRPVDVTTMVFAPNGWDELTSYALGSIVDDGTGLWFSCKAPFGTTANPPIDDSLDWTAYFGPVTALPWDEKEVYFVGELVYVFDDVLLVNVTYLSLKNDNKNNLVTDPLSWLPLIGTLTPFFITYPAGVGPSSERTSQNLYVLPRGFMREAPQHPKAGRYSILGYPGNFTANDWVFENTFFVSMCAGVIIFRFAADITNADEFDPMFVEGLGARIGMEICERLTQSTTKKEECKDDYKKIMGEARIVNGIEQGPTEQPLDDYIVSRV